MVNQTDSLDSSWVNLGTEENQEITKDRRYSGDSGIEEKEELEVLDGKNQEIQANLCDTPPEDLSLENAILTNFPDSCDRSFTVESEDEDSYDIIPKNLTLTEIINILNQAIREDDCEELGRVIQNIENYEGRYITLDNVNLKSFCEQQLNLDLRDRRDHQHIYSNILSRYNFDQENFKCDYLVKELVLMAIAANDKLIEQYQGILFAEGNLSLLSLLVGGQKYIEAFIEKFHGTDWIYRALKDQAIQFIEPNKISFFSAIALRKERNLLDTVFVEFILKDLAQALKTSKPDPLYGVLETASLIENEEFIMIVLGAFEGYINDTDKKDLLRKSFVTLLETAISQEHISVVEYLCKRYTNSADCAIYDVYKQAFTDDKVITILRQQILKNTGARRRKEIYDLILKTALDAGNVTFIEYICKECAESVNDVIHYLDHKLKNNEFDEAYESVLVALSNIENTNVIVNVPFYTKKIYQNVSHKQVVRQAIRNTLRNATHYSAGQEDYSLIKKACYLYTEEGAINVIFQEECGVFKSSIEKRIEELEKENKLLQSEALREYNYSYLPGIVNGLAQTAYIAYDEYTKDPKDNKRQKNIDLIFSLMQIRNILQFSIDVQEYSCHERQDLWDEMHQTPGTFIIRKRSNNVADELEIPVITSDNLSENPGLESAASKQVEKDVLAQKGESDILDGIMVSIMNRISDNFEEDRVHSSDQNTRSIEEELSDAIFGLDYKAVECLVERVKQEDNNAERIINRALEKAHEIKVEEKDQESESEVKKIREFLAVESKSIGAAAGRQEVPVAEPKESESDSPNSEDDDYSKLESDKSAGDSSGSSINYPFEEINEVRIPVIETIESVATAMVSEMPAMATEESKFEPDNLNDEQDDQQNLTVPTVSSSVSEDVSTSRSNEEESVVITQGSQNDGEHDKVIPEEHQDDDAMQNMQPKTLVVDSNPSNTGVEGNKKKQALVQLTEPVSKNAQGNSKQPSYPNKNNPNPQDAKSKLPVIAASMLAITGVATGIAVAVYLEMLAVGIAVGVCCLVAAAIVYCYSRPSSSLENSNVQEKIARDVT
ncbi:hypothetical protein HUB92_01605 [Wolbachia endosymbiont of Wiebesia pumilae]|uniref:host RNA manipulator TomO n=1 Tax=Wolbachia endosymbiont of Wiebesia pumilae TaxID=2742717 RepID=UPI001AE31B39|nr:hypothetical protein [Wolbachia endosymbiont of Wiebesia pumilae]QTP61654.1 hypothetical protein HUB92_01605 [Wolbachia endosymbiont of Wiebesia pumilae]